MPEHSAESSRAVWLRVANEFPDCKGYLRPLDAPQTLLPSLDGKPEETGASPYGYGYRFIGGPWFL